MVSSIDYGKASEAVESMGRFQWTHHDTAVFFLRDPVVQISYAAPTFGTSHNLTTKSSITFGLPPSLDRDCLALGHNYARKCNETVK